MNVRSLGSGDPITVVAHGLGTAPEESRLLLTGTPGTKLLYAARGHGDAPPPIQGGYGELAADLLAVADAHGATRALGTSLGASTLLHLLALRPERFEKVVLWLPAAPDGLRDPVVVRRLDALAAAIEVGDEDRVEAYVLADLPEGLDVGDYVRSRVAYLLDSTGLPALLAGLDAAVPDLRALRSVTADALVLAQEGDPVHPVEVARSLAAVLPSVQLVVFERPDALFTERARLRSLVAAHLT